MTIIMASPEGFLHSARIPDSRTRRLVVEPQINTYRVDLLWWNPYVDKSSRSTIEEVISWSRPQEAAWYPLPGRTFVLPVGKERFKIKGAGFYNPGDVSYSGTKRTISPVPEGREPMPPLPRLFERDLVHADPSSTPPHALESVHSIPAPVGGMTARAALHDQEMFARLRTAGLPSNTPVAAYVNRDLQLNGEAMGISVSRLPEDALPITAFQPFIMWDRSALSPEPLRFLQEYSGRGETFSYDNPGHRLELLAKFSEVAGKLLFDFSAEAGLYRFSGGPDNWNIKGDMHEPLYFSDVDTSRSLDTIPPTQHGWEVLRNFNSAIHNWFYYFLPTLSHPESGYTAAMVQEKQHDFVHGMLRGFFHDKPEAEIEQVARTMWDFFAAPMEHAEKADRLGLRTGEHFLQQFYQRPVFHAAMISMLAGLIQDSHFQHTFTQTDTSPAAIKAYLDASIHHESHKQMFPNYSPAETQLLVDEFFKRSLE